MAMRRSLAAVVLLAAGVAGSSGCSLAFYRGPAGVEGALERQLDCDLDRQFGLKLGLVTAPLVSGIVRSAADAEDDAFVRELHLRKVGVAVFAVERPASRRRRLDPGELGLSGWDTLLRVKEDGEQVLVMSRPARNGGIKDVVLLSYDGDEVVVVRLKGDLDRLIRAAAEAASRDGDS
jgi:hypothetical protein